MVRSGRSEESTTVTWRSGADLSDYPYTPVPPHKLSNQILHCYIAVTHTYCRSVYVV